MSLGGAIGMEVSFPRYGRPPHGRAEGLRARAGKKFGNFLKFGETASALVCRKQYMHMHMHTK